MMAYADLMLPDTTYLERYDCISMLDRPIGEVDVPAMRCGTGSRRRAMDAVPGSADRDGRAPRLTGFTTAEGARRYPADYPDYMVNHDDGRGRFARWMAW